MNKSFNTELTFNKFVLKHIYINIAVPDDSIKPLLKIKFEHKLVNYSYSYEMVIHFIEPCTWTHTYVFFELRKKFLFFQMLHRFRDEWNRLQIRYYK